MAHKTQPCSRPPLNPLMELSDGPTQTPEWQDPQHRQLHSLGYVGGVGKSGVRGAQVRNPPSWFQKGTRTIEAQSQMGRRGAGLQVQVITGSLLRWGVQAKTLLPGAQGSLWAYNFSSFKTHFSVQHLIPLLPFYDAFPPSCFPKTQLGWLERWLNG